MIGGQGETISVRNILRPIGVVMADARPKHKRPRPPKEWYPSGHEMPTISGNAFDGSIVVHPTQFKKLVEAGVIDEKGRRL